MTGQTSSVTKSSHGGSDHRFLPGQVPAAVPAQACSFLSKGQSLPDVSLSPWLHIEDNMPLKCQSSPSPDPWGHPATRSRDHTILIAVLFRTPSLCAVNVHYPVPTNRKEVCACLTPYRTPEISPLCFLPPRLPHLPPRAFMHSLPTMFSPLTLNA